MPLKLKSESAKPLSPAAAKLRLLKRLRCTLRFEKKFWQRGARFVAGVDEVGRGSLFGPVVAAAVILDPGYRIRGLRDSKLLLAERREVLAERIRQHAVAWAVAAVDAARIDQINIYQASRLAMREAVSRLDPGADHLLVDALRLDCELPQQAIIHGDALSASHDLTINTTKDPGTYRGQNMPEPTIDNIVADGTDFVRADADYDCGITGLMKIAHSAEGFGLDVETGGYWQANELGQTRVGWV